MKKFIEDKNANEANRQAWNEQKSKVQKVVDLYNKTGLATLQPGELQGLFTDTDNLLHDKLTGGEAVNVQAGGSAIPLKRAAAMQFIDKPKEWDGLTHLIAATTDQLTKGATWDGKAKVWPNTIAHCFVLDAAGKVQFSDATQANIESYGITNVISKTGANVAAFLEAVEKAYAESGLADDKFWKADPLKLLTVTTKGWNAASGQFNRDSSFVARDREIAAIEK